MARDMNYVAYVDESGTNELDSSKNGVSHLFVCAAVLVKQGDVECVADYISKVAQRMCSGAEIKSSKIGSNHIRRMKFIESIMDIDFKYYAMFINKSNVDKKSGLKFKQSYYKYINSLIYEKISREYANLHIIADSIGGRDYMESMAKYLKGKMPNLLSKFTHDFGDSSKDRLLQLADIVSGTLAYCFDEKKQCQDTLKIRDMLRCKEIEIEVWPPVHRCDVGMRRGNSDDLELSARNRAIDFINRTRNSNDDDEKMQGFVVKELLHLHIFGDGDRCIPSAKLIDGIESQGFEKMTEHGFRNRIIGRIRDGGVILAGTSRGYKLAASQSDVYEYLDHNRKNIEPMLGRIRRAKSVINSDTERSADIFALPEFYILNKILDVYVDSSVQLKSQKVYRDSIHLTQSHHLTPTPAPCTATTPDTTDSRRTAPVRRSSRFRR